MKNVAFSKCAKHLKCTVDHSRPRAPESRAARASVAPAARHRFLRLTLYYTHSLLCGKTRRQSVLAERKLSSFDGAQSTRFAAFPSTHRSICLDYWHPRLQKHNPQSFSEGGFVRFPSICAWQLCSSARGFRIYLCFAVSRTRAQVADFSSLRRLTTWICFKSHIGLIRLKCQHQYEDTHVRWVLSRIITTALIFRVVSKDLL